MDAHSTYLFEIFPTNTILEVPFYQREYVWDEKEWEKMLCDAEKVSSENNKTFFAGTVILKQEQTNSGDLRTVVDGQQRLTTLFILLKILCLIKNEDAKFTKAFTDDNGKISLHHTYHDKEAFEEIMNLTELKDLHSNALNSKSKIYSAYEFFYKNSERVSKLDFNKIGHNFKFARVNVGPDDDEQEIFDTINSAGKPLSTPELLKNFLFRNRNETDLEQYQTYWLDVFEKDDETKSYWFDKIKAKNSKLNNKIPIELFFLYFLQVKRQDKNLPQQVNTKDKDAFLKENDLFYSYKKFINEYLNGERDELLKDIKKYAQIFRQTFNNWGAEDTLTGLPGIERLNTMITVLDYSKLMPYILYVEVEYEDADDQTIKEKNELYAYLESYLMRRYITKVSTNSDDSLFDSMIQNEVLTKEDLEQFIAKRFEVKNRQMPTDDEISKEVREREFYKNNDKYATNILYMLESKIRNNDRYATDLKGIHEYSLEHMMPDEWREKWPEAENEELRDFKLKTLGNLAIITQPLNSSISNNDWKTKKEGKGDNSGLNKYASGLETLFGALEKEVWDEDAIDERADKLCEKILEVWPRGNVDEYIKQNAEKKSIPVDLSKPDLCTNKNPLYFQFEGGEKIFVSSWKNVYVEIVNAISDSDPSLLRQYIGKSLISTNADVRSDILEEKDIDQMRDGLKLNSGLCLETHFSAKDIVKRIDSVLKIYNYPEKSLYIAMT